jgi:transposase
MLLFIFTLGGLLLMMGHQSRSEALFYYFRLEDQVPENHLLRLIDRHVSFDFVRAKLKGKWWSEQSQLTAKVGAFLYCVYSAIRRRDRA